MHLIIKNCLKVSAVLLFCITNGYAGWQQVEGIEGGSVEACTFHRGVIYASCDLMAPSYGGSISYRSADSGRTWTPALEVLGAGDSLVFGIDSHRVFHLSRDNGVTWDATSGKLTNLGLYDFAADDDIFAAAITSWLFISADRGTTWNAAMFENDSIAATACAVTGDTVYGSAGGYFYHSTDKGEQWVRKKFENSGGTVRSIAVDGSVIYAGDQTGIYRSTDQGDHWMRIDSTVPEPYSGGFELTAHKGTVAAVCDSGLFVSGNGGNTWKRCVIGGNRSYVQCAAVEGRYIVAGLSDGGINISADGGATWSAVNDGIHHSWIIALENMAGSVLLTTRTGIFRSADLGKSWLPADSGLGSYPILCIGAQAGRFLAGTRQGGVFTSVDTGRSWSAMNAQLREKDIIGATIKGDTVFALSRKTAGNTLYIATGETCSPVKGLIGKDSLFFTSCAVVDTTILLLEREGLWHSGDNGLKWSRNGNLKNLMYFSVSDSCIIAFPGVGDAFSCSIDRGMTWKNGYTVPQPVLYIHYTTINSTIFAASDKGVHYSTDLGETWTDFSAGLPPTVVYSISVCDSMLFAGTLGSGLWIRNISEIQKLSATVGRAVTVAKPPVRLLYAGAGYRPAVELLLKNPSTVTLEMMTLAGRRIAAVKFGTLPSGRHIRYLPAVFGADGVYIVRTAINNEKITQKLIGPCRSLIRNYF